MRRILAIVLAIACCPALCGPAAAQDTKVVVLNGGSQEARTCRQLGCTPAVWGNASTYSAAVGQANAQKIQTYVASMSASGRLGLIVDDDYAIADHDGDNIDILIPGINGGFIITPGKNTLPNLNPSQQQPEPDPIGGGFWHVGDPGDTMIEYHGVSTYLDLKLVGALTDTWNNLITAQQTSQCAGDLLRMINLVDASSNPDPRGVKTTLDLYLFCGINGVNFPDDPDVNHTDTVKVTNIWFDLLDDVYRVDSWQALQHLIVYIKHGGTYCDNMFNFLQAGDLHVEEFYGPNGNLLHIGPNVGHNSANFVFENGKFDANLVNGNARPITLLDCESYNSNTRVRMGGNIGWPSQSTHWQMVKRLEGANGSGPDIQLDFKGLNKAEAAAYHRRPMKGESAWSPQNTIFPTTAVSSTKFWLDPTDASTLTGTLTEGGEISAVDDKSGTGNDLTAGVNFVYAKKAINFLPGVDEISGEVTRYLKNETPVDLDNNVNDLTIMVVLKHRQAAAGTSSMILSCEDVVANENTRNGFAMAMHDQTGVLSFKCANTWMNHTQPIDPWRPTLVTCVREGSTGHMFMVAADVVTANSNSVSPGALTAVNGPLVIGAREFGNDNFQKPFKGWISQVLIDTDDLCTVFDGTLNTASTDATGTTITCTGYDVTSGDVGKRLHIIGGTNFMPSYVTVTSVNAGADTLTVDQDVSIASSATGMIGVLESPKYSERVDYLRAAFGVW